MRGPSTTWRLDPAVRRELRIGWPTRYDWHRGTRHWVDPIMRGMRDHGVRIERREVQQTYPLSVVIEVDDGRGRDLVVIDHADHFEVNGEAAGAVLLYFKMNYLTEGYPQGNVLPGGYVCASPVIYRRLPILRAMCRSPRFAYDVYGRFGLRFPSETRKRAYAILSAREDLRYEGSLYRYPGGPDKVPYKRYLREITRAKVCVDMPNGGDMTFRLIDYLAIGACVVRPSGPTRLHVPLGDGEHIALCAPDLSDLGDVCARLVSDERERTRIARNARDFFDRYLHRRQLGAYYLSEIWRAMEARRRG